MLFAGYYIRPYEYVSGLNWDYVWNGLWCVIATMTTVGYGDYYPRTYLGRGVVILAAVMGALFVSLMVVAMSNSSMFDHAESRVIFFPFPHKSLTIIDKIY